MEHPRWQRALLLYGQSRHDLAEGELRQLLGEAPNFSPAHALLARVLAERERYDEATQEAMQAVHLAPDDAFAYQSLAVVMFRRHRYREAEQAVQEAIGMAPEWAANYSLLSQIHLAEHRWPDALAAADKGLALDAEDTDCANLKAMALVKLGRRDEAQAIGQRTLSQAPEDALSHANQGWTLLQQGQPAKALEHFQEALRLDPSYDGARQGIVEALKARNIVYRAMLGWFFWMNRLNSGARWAVILGGYFGYRALRVVARGNPQLAPYVTPLLIAYVVFVVMTWISVPLGNLLLRLNRFGRLALSREQIITSNWVGGCLLGAAALAIAALALRDGSLLQGALVFVLMIPALAAIYNCERGWPRNAMTAITVVLAILGGISTLLSIALSFNLAIDKQVMAIADQVADVTFLGFIVLALISQFAANALVGAEVKR